MLKKKIPGKHVLFLLGFALCFLSATNSYAACTSPAGAEGKILYNQDFHVPQYCDGTDWISMGGVAPAAGGGGDPTYAGLTSSTYNGNWRSASGGSLYGQKAGDSLCNSSYSGSRVMTDEDLKIKSVRDSITSTNTGWFVCLNFVYDGSSDFLCNIGGNATVTSRSEINCRAGGFYGGSSLYKGSTYKGSNGLFGVVTCDNSLALHCVTD